MSETSTPLPVGDPVPPAAGKRPPREPLAGRFVTLLPVDPAAHAEALFAASHGDAATEFLWTYMGYGPFADAAAMRAWMKGCGASEDPLFFTVVDRRGQTPVGMVSFLNIDTGQRRLELGHIWYAPAAQRSAINTEAVTLMLRRSFEELACRRVEWKCDALNARSRAAARRLGFSFEGVFAQHMIVKGRNRDTAWFAMLDSDWPAVRANLARWLDAAAAADGAPVLSLAELNRPLLRPALEA